MMVAEAVKFFVRAIFAIDDQCLMLWDVAALAKILEHGWHFRFEACSKKLAADIFESIVLARDNVERSLSVTRLDALQGINLHFLEENAALRQFVAKKWAVGMIGIDGFTASHPASETDDDHVRTAAGRSFAILGFC